MYSFVEEIEFTVEEAPADVYYTYDNQFLDGLKPFIDPVTETPATLSNGEEAFLEEFVKNYSSIEVGRELGRVMVGDAGSGMRRGREGWEKVGGFGSRGWKGEG